MKTPNPDHPIRNTLKHLALAVAVAGGLLAGTALAAAANDDFANAIDLTGVAAGQTGDNLTGTQTGTNNIAATLEVGEPNPGATNTVWFKWTCPADGAFTYGTLGSRNGAATEWDAIIAIYTGAAVNDLVLIGGPKDTTYEESMTIPVTNGTTYFIQLAGYEGDTAANLLLSWNFVPAAPPTIVSFTPPDGIPTVVESDLVLTFTKPIAFDSGNITIKDLTTPANDRVIPVDPLDPQVSISGRVLTINPATDLVLGNSYAVQIDATAIMDLAGQPFAGILDDTTWNFTTVAAATPTTTTVVSSGTPSTYGDNVTFTATVAPVPSGGTVQFQNDGSNLGAPVPVNTSTGKATVTTSLLGVAGLNKIYAEYSGNFQFAGSTSTSILQGVTKAGLTVTAQNVARFPNTANPVPLPYQITGFKNGQTLGTSGVTGEPALSTTADLDSPVGTYPITPAVGTLAAANYDFTSFVEGTLTVVDPASPIAINVNIDHFVRPVLVGPAGGLGAVWNTTAAKSMANLLLANGPTSTVAFSSFSAGDNWDGPDAWGNPSLALIKEGLRNFALDGPENWQKLVISNLNAAKKYDLYIASANCLASQKSYGVWKTTTNTTSTPGDHVCDNTANIIGDNWVLGNNYVLFEDVVPDGSGKITVDGYGIGGYRLPLNGFQLVEAVPRPATITSFGTNVVGSSAVIGLPVEGVATIDWTVPYASGATPELLAALAPEFTLFSGECTDQISGVAPVTPDFSAGPVTYTVTDDTTDPVTTNVYTVTVTVLPPFTMALTGDGTTGFSEYGGEADGFRFQTLGSDLAVNWLGFYDAPNNDETGTVGDGLLASHRVSIWLESDGSLVAQTTVLTTDALEGNFRGNNITPVTLTANTGYVIAADYGGGDRMREGDDLTGWGIHGISDLAGRYGGAGGGMPTDGWGVMVGPNFGTTGAVGGGYTGWAADNGATGQTPEQDHDNDGVENGIEYFMGETGSSFTAMPGLDATNTVTWPMDAAYQGTYEVQTSTDLGTWENVDPRPTPSGGSLSYLLPPGAPGGTSFVRLLVTPAP